MQGYTEAEFRLAWAIFFSGIDVAVSPFIPLSEGIVFRAKLLNDIMPGRNQKLAVVPQVLGNNSEQIIRLARRIADLGYETINWNLGCPKISVAKKQRVQDCYLSPPTRSDQYSIRLYPTFLYNSL